MTEWGVFLVISTLLTFAIAIIAPIVKLNTTITKLDITMEGLNEKLKELTENNKEAHKRIWTKLDAHEERLDEHEIGINVMKNQQNNQPPDHK